VERYLSPVSGRRTTILFPAFSERLATTVAACRAAPEEIPTRRPSYLAAARDAAKASSFWTGIISS
jgi:hypothetical protein